MKKDKTNAMRILDKEKIEYSMMSYNPEDGKIDGISVAQKSEERQGKCTKHLFLKGLARHIMCSLFQ